MTIEIGDLKNYIQARRSKILDQMVELSKSARSGKKSPEKAAIESVALRGADEELDLVAEQFNAYPNNEATKAEGK